MARNVNVWLTNWHWTGKDILVPQAQVNIQLEWTDEDGMSHEWEGTATFPNDLQLLPTSWLKGELEDLILRAARKRLGID